MRKEDREGRSGGGREGKGGRREGKKEGRGKEGGTEGGKKEGREEGRVGGREEERRGDLKKRIFIKRELRAAVNPQECSLSLFGATPL